jgi:phage terminase large subunit-like protein
VTLASATVQIVITEQVSDSAKIDPLMAEFNAVALMAANPWSAQPSVTWI